MNEQNGDAKNGGVFGLGKRERGLCPIFYPHELSKDAVDGRGSYCQMRPSNPVAGITGTSTIKAVRSFS